MQDRFPVEVAKDSGETPAELSISVCRGGGGGGGGKKKKKKKKKKKSMIIINENAAESEGRGGIGGAGPGRGRGPTGASWERGWTGVVELDCVDNEAKWFHT